MRKLRESQRNGIIVAKIFRINRTKNKELENKKDIYWERGGERQRARDKHQGNLKERRQK
jgi:hypothetical protein